MAIIFHRLASREFVSARRWYGRRNQNAENRFVAALRDALRAAESGPTLAPQFLRNYRWKRIKRFPYVIYFEPVSNLGIYVYAIAHTSRRPGYWLARARQP